MNRENFYVHTEFLLLNSNFSNNGKHDTYGDTSVVFPHEEQDNTTYKGKPFIIELPLKITGESFHFIVNAKKIIGIRLSNHIHTSIYN